MFQFAAGAALARRRGVSHLLDVSDYQGYRFHHGFELSRAFDLDVPMAREEEVRAVLGWRGRRLIRRVFARRALAPFRPPGYVLEPHFHYWGGIGSVPSKAYLCGYWQSERYFEDCRDVVRQWFRFRTPPQNSRDDWLQRIRDCSSVSVHVRRGDYAANPGSLSMHGTLDVAYYARAAAAIRERVERPQFFVFSDDVQRARSEVTLGVDTFYVSRERDSSSHRDLQLISLCKHHIIANSTFSWWGAWLSSHCEKVVVGPRRWFAGITADTRDLLPSTWIRT